MLERIHPDHNTQTRCQISWNSFLCFQLQVLPSCPNHALCHPISLEVLHLWCNHQTLRICTQRFYFGCLMFVSLPRTECLLWTSFRVCFCSFCWSSVWFCALLFKGPSQQFQSFPSSGLPFLSVLYFIFLQGNSEEICKEPPRTVWNLPGPQSVTVWPQASEDLPNWTHL